MHELSLLRTVVDAVERVVAERGAAGVDAVGLRVGTLSGAVPEALAGAWPIVTTGTVVAGARLDIEVVQAAVRCAVCARAVPIDALYALVCPVCGTPSGDVVTGRELAVAYADLSDAGTPGHSHRP